MDRVFVSNVVQLGEPGCLPRDIIARKYEKSFFGRYEKTGTYCLFGARLCEIVFNLKGVGNNPPAMARMMLSWWNPSKWGNLHDRIFTCLRRLFVGHRKFGSLLDYVHADSDGRKVVVNLAILVLTKVNACNLSKQRLIIEVLGEFLGARRVWYDEKSSDSEEKFTRSCIFGDHLRHIDLIPEMGKLDLKESDFETINEHYQRSLQIAELKVRELALLQTFLGRFVKFDRNEIQHVVDKLKDKSLRGLWQHCKDIRNGEPKTEVWPECQLHKLFVALFESCSDADNICGFCWMAERPTEETRLTVKCLNHKKALSEPRSDDHSAPPQDLEDETRECKVCFKPFNCVLVPCGHTCCMDCGRQLKICPICRAEIKIRQRVYF